MNKSTGESHVLPLSGLRICLIFPNVALEHTAALAQNVHALGAIQPLSLLYVAGILEESGAEVCVVDATARGLSLEDPSGIAAPTFAPNRI